jgi:thymidylate synthase (FAD)
MELGHTINVLDHGYVRLVDFMGSDQRIVESARISYNSKSKGDEQDKKLLSYLYKMKHSSPFEMCKISFNIKMPIFVMRQYIRHRVQNVNEISYRYSQPPSDFYIPKEWRKQDTKNKQGSVTEENWNPVIYSNEISPIMLSSAKDPNDPNSLGFTREEMQAMAEPPVHASELLSNFCQTAYQHYTKMIEAGVAKEMARMILPVNLYTEIYCCWDLRNLLHFISLREDSHAQVEIQEYAKAMKQIATELFPWTFQAYEKYKWELKEEIS